MLSLRARREIFGIAFESVFEAGDALAILKDLQHDDWNLAVFAFRVKWEKILKILINLNAWIIGEEANELIAHFMNYYKIFNYEIWEEVINTDQTLHIWHVNYREEYQSQKERFYSEETSLKSSEKSETEKQKLIRAIFSALMIDTPVIQNDIALKRNNKIYKDELLLALKKIAHLRIKTTAEETKTLLQIEFPFVPSAEVDYVDEIFDAIFEKIKPLRQQMADLPEKADSAYLTSTIPIMESGEAAVDDDDLIDKLFDGIQLPPMTTKEAITVSNGNGPKIVMKETTYAVNAQSICNLLFGLINQLGLDEIMERAMEELRNINKHSRDCEKIGDYWQILKVVERDLVMKALELQSQNNDLALKVKKLVSAVSMYKIHIGSDREIFKNAQYILTVQ